MGVDGLGVEGVAGGVLLLLLVVVVVVLGLECHGLGRAGTEGMGADVGCRWAGGPGWKERGAWDVHWARLSRGLLLRGVRMVPVMGWGLGSVGRWIAGSSDMEAGE
jgi:hypothetical protein